MSATTGDAARVNRRQTELLVSIPNVAAAPRPSCLLRLNVETQSKEWIDIGFGPDLASGSGIWADDAWIYHIYVENDEGFSSHITILDRSTFDVLHVQRLPEVYDGHSLCRVGDELFIASTGTDQILAYPMDGLVLGPAREVWSPSGSGTDTHHVNSLTYVDGELYCTAFGPKTGEGWSTAQTGYVRNVTSGVNVLEGLRQPHTVTWHEGQMWLCNSVEGSVNLGGDPVAFLSGYARGIAFGPDDTLYVGASLARRAAQPSEDGGEFDNPGGMGAVHGQCAVVHMSQSGTNRVEIAIPPFGNEVYDILVL